MWGCVTLKINMGIMDFSNTVNSSKQRDLNLLTCSFFYFCQMYFIQYIQHFIHSMLHNCTW